MQELDKKIIKWASNKGIVKSSSPLKQLTKTFEELAELTAALVQKDESETKDAIGDTYVTLAILKKLLQPIKSVDSDLANSSVFITILWVVEIFQKVSQGKDPLLDIMRAQDALSKVAKERGFTLEECAQSAYDVISKRTGKMVNGIFVKDNEELETTPSNKPVTKKSVKEVNSNE